MIKKTNISSLLILYLCVILHQSSNINVANAYPYMAGHCSSGDLAGKGSPHGNTGSGSLSKGSLQIKFDSKPLLHDKPLILNPYQEYIVTLEFDPNIIITKPNDPAFFFRGLLFRLSGENGKDVEDTFYVGDDNNVQVKSQGCDPNISAMTHTSNNDKTSVSVYFKYIESTKADLLLDVTVLREKYGDEWFHTPYHIQIGDRTPEIPSCAIDDVVGQTHYFAADNACWKLQLFPGGTLEGDFTDPTCSKPSYTSGGVFSLFDYVDKETNEIAFRDGPMKYSGTFKFSEASDVSEQGAEVLSWNRDEKEYELEIVIPSCKDVSTSCAIDDVVGQTHYFAAENACWKLQLFPGGTLEGDFTDPTCSKPSYTSGGVFSLFDYVDKETNEIAFRDGPMKYSGTFKFSEASDVSEQGAEVLSWNRDEKEYELEIVIPSCKDVDRACNSYTIGHPTNNLSTTLWTNGGGIDSEWINKSNWRFDNLPGFTKFQIVIMAAGDKATVH